MYACKPKNYGMDILNMTFEFHSDTLMIKHPSESDRSTIIDFKPQILPKYVQVEEYKTWSFTGEGY